MDVQFFLSLLGLLILIAISGFFSSAETGMMSLNRYRLRHLARKKNKAACRVLELLQRPDRLLGVILLGNTLANVLASSLATIIALQYFGNWGAILNSVILTVIILIFSETAPKTLAAMYPERVAFPSSGFLSILLKVFYPVVWLINGVANSCLNLLHFPVKSSIADPLTIEELRSVVNEARGKTSTKYQQMLLRIIDFEQEMIDNIMVPRNEIYGIDINASWDMILDQIRQCNHAYVPLYRDNIDQVIGMLNLRKVLIDFSRNQLTKEKLIQLVEDVYFLPEGALVNRQLVNFQMQKRKVGLAVDEYGMVVGLLTLQDVLEEIIGEFAVDDKFVAEFIKLESDGSYLVEGNLEVKDLRRLIGWKLPTDGPRTLSGLLIEYLEMIPETNICVRISGYPMEIVRVDHNTIKLVRIWPELRSLASPNEARS